MMIQWHKDQSILTGHAPAQYYDRHGFEVEFQDYEYELLVKTDGYKIARIPLPQDCLAI